MYRNSAQIKCIGPNALPSPDNTSDSDTELLDVLEHKRRQLEEEVARFRAAKDREFREFERELRGKRKRSRPGSDPASYLTPTRSPASTNSSALNLLAATQNGSLSPRTGARFKRDGKPAPLSGPTLSLDKLNITAETIPASNTALGTPPTPTLLKRVRSRSPIFDLQRPVTPPPSQSEKTHSPLLTPIPSQDRDDPFSGVFTPAYLPLLDAKDPRNVQSPPPLSSADEDKKRLDLDATTKQQAEEQQRQLESSQSLPPQHVSPTVIANKRTHSASALPNITASLPSALRSASGGDRRRKHVKFQLADLAVVDPSSSYEEGPSPELDEVGSADRHQFSPPRPNPKEQPQYPTNKRPPSSPLLSPSERERERRRGRVRNARFVSPMPSPLGSPNPNGPARTRDHSVSTTSPLPSPSLAHATLISSPAESGFSNGLAASEDGGSGVGFFELDEELASPGLREGNPVESFDLVGEEDMRNMGLGIGREKKENEVPSVMVGSVPIDIVGRGSAFVGSYGH